MTPQELEKWKRDNAYHFFGHDPEPGQSFHVDHKFNVSEYSVEFCNPNTIRALEFKLHGFDCSNSGCMIVHHGRGDIDQCAAAMFDIDDIDPKQAFALGHFFLDIAKQAYYDEEQALKDDQ